MAPAALDADRGTGVLLDERWTPLAADTYRRLSLWRRPDGRRDRVLQIVTEQRGAWRVATETKMSADYFIVARRDGGSEWEKKAAQMRAERWTIRRSGERSRVARFSSPALSADTLDSLDAAFFALRDRLGRDFRVGWSYYLQPALTPNDSQYPSQWSWPHIGAPAAWTETVGSGEVVVAIVDSGIDPSHPELQGNLWTNPAEAADGVDTSGSGYVDDLHGWNFVDDTNSVDDPNGHGTGVAGIIGATGDNHFGIAGAAWQVRLMPLRVGQSDIAVEDVIDAIDYAVDRRALDGENVVAINLSLGGHIPGQAADAETPLFLAVQRACDAGILCVAAAGNWGTDNDALLGGVPNHFFPSDFALDNIISVAASTPDDSLSESSNFGATSVDLAAPGTNILTTDRNGGFQTVSGTSFAAPHVTGLLALIQAKNPDLDAPSLRRIVFESLSPAGALQGKLVQAGRLAYDGGMVETLRWPLVETAAEWSDFPFLSSTDTEPLPVRVTVADNALDSVHFELGSGGNFAASSDGFIWSVDWQPSDAGTFDWSVTAAGAGARTVVSQRDSVQVLAPFPFWQAGQFGEDFELQAAAYVPAADGWTLAERFVFGVDVDEPPPPPVAGVPVGGVLLRGANSPDSIQLRFWQAADALPAEVTVQGSTTLGAESWSAVAFADAGVIINDTSNQRVLRELTITPAGSNYFYRLHFDLSLTDE